MYSGLWVVTTDDANPGAGVRKELGVLEGTSEYGVVETVVTGASEYEGAVVEDLPGAGEEMHPLPECAIPSNTAEAGVEAVDVVEVVAG